MNQNPSLSVKVPASASGLVVPLLTAALRPLRNSLRHVAIVLALVVTVATAFAADYPRRLGWNGVSFQGYRFSIEVVEVRRDYWTFFIRNDNQMRVTSVDIQWRDKTGTHVETEPYRMGPGENKGGWAMFTPDSQPSGFRIVSLSYIGNDQKEHTLTAK